MLSVCSDCVVVVSCNEMLSVYTDCVAVVSCNEAVLQIVHLAIVSRLQEP